jgi:hypothetical protein
VAVSAAVALVAAGSIAVAVTLATQPAPVARPSETPAPTPSASPSASPSSSATVSPSPSLTAMATVAPTPRPRPTTRTAGERILPYYFEVRKAFPLFPSAPQIDFDEPAGEDGDAWFRGINARGEPIFAVREDYVMTPSTAYHEIGHAYEELLKRKNASIDWRGLYWSFRGFPGTWQDAARDAATQPVGMAQWIHLPGESWAEAFSVALVGTGREKTLDYGRTINPTATKQFFISLQNQPAP